MHKPGSFNAGQRDMKFSYVVLAKGSGHFKDDVLNAVDGDGAPAERMDWGRLIKDPMLKKKHLILSGITHPSSTIPHPPSLVHHPSSLVPHASAVAPENLPPQRASLLCAMIPYPSLSKSSFALPAKTGHPMR